MSILTEVNKIFESTTNDGQQQNLVPEAVTMLTSREGGLNALTQNFEQNGLGHKISSWIGPGVNLANSLPHLVGGLTPNGEVGGANDLLSRGKEILAAFASKKQGV